MALINYIEPASAGSVLAGFGVLIMTIFIAYIIYRLVMPMIRFLESLYNRELRFNVVEEKLLDEYAKEKGIDLDKEILSRNYMRKQNKSLRKRMEEEIFNKFFPKKKEGK